jgi:hypothetical protein
MSYNFNFSFFFITRNVLKIEPNRFEVHELLGQHKSKDCLGGGEAGAEMLGDERTD